jgi:integrase
VTSHYFRKTVATLMDEVGLSARSATDHLGHAKPSTADIYMGRKKGVIGPAEVLEARPTLIGSALGPMPRGPLGTDLAPGF